MLVDNLDRDQYRKFLKDTVIKGQKCQRNWDLSKQIPEEDLDVIIHAATQCPSKQNLDLYSLLVIQNREIQEKIYENTWTRPGEEIGRYNPQVLANTLLVFLPKMPSDYSRNREVKNIDDDFKLKVLKEDRHQAVGVAAGFVNVIAQSLGYSTGCNRCFNPTAIKEILNIDVHPVLMMGIGFKDEQRNRRMEHVKDTKVQSFKKLPIPITFIDNEGNNIIETKSRFIYRD